MAREAIGSWLRGPRSAVPAGADAEAPGARLGLPERGPGAIAGVGSRLLAFVLDAVLCNLVAWGLLRDGVWVTAVFVAEVLVLTALGGASAGQRLVGMRVVRLDGGPLGLPGVLLRTLLLLLVVPALVWDRDGRGLHDRAARSVLVRTR